MDTPELDRFLDSLQAAGVPADDLPALREGATAILRAAGGTPVRPVHVDEALRHARWQGAAPAALTAIQRAGERLVAWQREAAAGTPAAPVAEPAAPAVSLEPEPEGFRWTATALQVCLAVAVLVVMSRVVSLEHATIKKTPAEIAMDEFLLREREVDAAQFAAERQQGQPRGPVGKVLRPSEPAMTAFRAAQSAAASGMLDEARQKFTRAVAFEPNFTEAYVELASVNLGLARKAAQAGERSDALRYFHDSLSDQRRARQLASGDKWYLYGDSWRRSSCVSRATQALADAERLERDDTLALAALGWRPGGSGARRYYRPSRYASGGGSYSAAPAERDLPGPTHVEPSVTHLSRVRPSIVRPAYVRPRVRVPADD